MKTSERARIPRTVPAILAVLILIAAAAAGNAAAQTGPPLDMKAIEAIRSANPEERAERDRRLRVINQCALDEGLYDAQDSAWLETISTMPKTDPEGAKALKEAGVVSALELEGPAPFLTIRAFTR